MTGGQNTSATILVVDDSKDNLVLLSLAMQERGYRVVTATNGEDAVVTAKLARPDLILMDIAMPQLDGLEATRRIREAVGMEVVPVIALTAFDTDGFRRAAHDAGFSGYLTKPIDFERLHKLISMLLADADDDRHTTDLTRSRPTSP
ncbi:MAG TPA: response regulator [Pyrinomonadaceae bacterium]|nr:response regulator [Pyrinomonadaceae bacterium]